VQLKKAFPGVKFSVRSSVYSGGASIDVSYTDGPTTDAVDAVCNQFKGANFDGMIDMKSYQTHYLDPDGTAHLAHDPGTQGSMGIYPERFGDPGPNSRIVSFGADFIFTHREHSPEFKAKVKSTFESVLGYALPDEDEPGYYEAEVPLAVGRDGELHHMVDSETERLYEVSRRYMHYLEA
jgi:hypothetical protein